MQNIYNMGIIGLIAKIIGVLALVGYGIIAFTVLKKLYKSTDRIKRIKTSQTISLKELLEMSPALENEAAYLELTGKVQCDNPIITPFNKIPTVFYEFRVEQFERDNATQIFEKTNACPFQLVDGSETVSVTVDPDIDMNLNEVKRKVFEGPQAVDGIPLEYEDFSLGAKNTGYRYVERYIPLDKTIFFIGNVDFHNGAFRLRPGLNTSFISDRPRKLVLEELGKDCNKHIGCLSLIGMVVFLTAFLFVGLTQVFWRFTPYLCGCLLHIIAFISLITLLILSYTRFVSVIARKIGDLLSHFLPR